MTIREELLDESISKPINDVNPVVAIPYSNSVHSIALTRGPRWLFTGGEDGLIRKFDFFQSVQGKSLLTVSQKHSLVDSIQFNGVLCSYWENEIPYYKSELKDAATSGANGSKKKGGAGDAGQFFEPKLSPVYSLCADNNGYWLLSGLSTGAITLQSVRSSEGSIQWYFPHGKDKIIKDDDSRYYHTSAVSCLVTNTEQTNFLSGSWDGKVLKWDLNTGKNMNVFDKSTSGGQISAVQYRPSIGTDFHWEGIEEPEEDDDMDSLFADDDDDNDNDNDNENENDNDNDEEGKIDKKDEDGKREYVPGSEEGPARDIRKLQRDAMQTGMYEGVRNSDDIFLSASIDGAITVWDSRLSSNANCVVKIPPPTSTPPWCMSATWSVDGDTIFVGRRNSSIEAFDLRNPTVVNKTLRFPVESGNVSCVRTMPNSDYLLCGCHDNIRLYDLKNEQRGSRSTVPFSIVAGHHGGVVSEMWVDPTCRFLISASGNRGWQGRAADFLFVYEFV